MFTTKLVIENSTSKTYKRLVWDETFRPTMKIQVSLPNFLPFILVLKKLSSLFWKLALFQIKPDLSEYDFKELERRFNGNKLIEKGGRYSPKRCKSECKMAIIIPYRDRLSHLKLFLAHMYPFLMNQNASFGIYVIEPLGNLTFSI
jgi:hypothetical protein